MKDLYKTIPVHNQNHVVKEVKRPNVVLMSGDNKIIQEIEQPNYRGSGMALCGILKPGQTLDHFVANHNKSKRA